MSPEHNIRFKFKAEITGSSYLELVVTSTKNQKFDHIVQHLDSENYKSSDSDVINNDITTFIKCAENDKSYENIKQHENIKTMCNFPEQESDDEIFDGVYTKVDHFTENDSTPLCVDISNMSQKVLDTIGDEDKIIQKFGLPFKAYLYSTKQLNFAVESHQQSNETNLIVHIDGTGNIVRKPYKIKSKKVMLHSILIRNRRFTLPLAELLSSDQDTFTIKHFLKAYRKFVVDNEYQWPLFRIVVTDWSWALINSVMSAWNKTDITQYLNETFDVLQHKKKIRSDLVILITCCAHFLKRVAKNVDKKFNITEDMRTFVLNCVSMMILCRTMDEVNEIYSIFMRILLTKEKFVAERNLKLIGEFYSHSDSDLVEQLGQKAEQTDLECLIDEKEGPIFKQSPYYSYYDERFTAIDQEMSDCKLTNDFFHRELALYITYRLMPFLPIWSCVLFPLLDLDISRLSNAYAESYFNVIKKYLLVNQKNLSIHHYADKSQSYINSLIKNEKLQMSLKSSLKGKTKYPENTQVKPLQEDVDLGEKDKRSRRKGQGLSKLAKKRSLNSSFVNIEKSKTFYDVITQNSKNSSDSNNSTNPHALQNGLIPNSDYYFATETIFVLGEYTIDNKRVSLNETYTVFLDSKAYETLKKEEFVDSQTIDCYIYTLLKSCENDITYVPLSVTNSFLDLQQYKHAVKSCAVSCTKPMTGKIFMPYRKGFHYLLLIADIEKKSLINIDPFYEKSKNEKSIKNKFENFLNACPEGTNFGSIKNLDWKLINLEKQLNNNRPLQKDCNNCGVYVSYYMSCLMKNEPFDRTFDPRNFRRQIASELIGKSDNMKHYCLYCATLRIGATEVMCRSCRRWSHDTCISEQENIAPGSIDWTKSEVKYDCLVCKNYERTKSN